MSIEPSERPEPGPTPSFKILAARVRALGRRGWRGGLVVSVLVLSAATAVAAPHFMDGRSEPSSGSGEATASGESLRARFAYLSMQHSNFCTLPASAIEAMPAGARLQGACCFAMNYSAYVKQLHELRHYADV